MNSTKNPTIFIHCQYVYGIGHFVRAVELAKGLSERFQVYLLNGGEVVPNFQLPSSVIIIQLPAIYKNESDDYLSPVDTSKSLQDCFTLREKIINEAVRFFKPDILITEHFPFGLLFEREVMGLIGEVKQVNPLAKIVGSVRDIIESSIGGVRDSHVCDILNETYDLLLVHGDEKFAPLSTSFPKINEMSIPVVQTGYISRRIPTIGDATSDPIILASVAGGRLGNELLDVLIDSHVKIRAGMKHKMVLFSGAFQKDFGVLKDKVASLESEDLDIHKFDSQKYMMYLTNASLIISLGGYNSIIESVSAKKPMLIYNRDFLAGNEEQQLRIRLFEMSGHLDVIKSEDLETKRISDIILDKLGKAHSPLPDLNLNGVKNSIDSLLNLLNI